MVNHGNHTTVNYGIIKYSSGKIVESSSATHSLLYDHGCGGGVLHAATILPIRKLHIMWIPLDGHRITRCRMQGSCGNTRWRCWEAFYSSRSGWHLLHRVEC